MKVQTHLHSGVIRAARTEDELALDTICSGRATTRQRSERMWDEDERENRLAEDERGIDPHELKRTFSRSGGIANVGNGQRARLKDEVETVAWALKKGRLMGLQEAQGRLDDMELLDWRIEEAIAKLEAELDPGRMP